MRAERVKNTPEGQGYPEVNPLRLGVGGGPFPTPQQLFGVLGWDAIGAGAGHGEVDGKVLGILAFFLGQN